MSGIGRWTILQNVPLSLSLSAPPKKKNPAELHAVVLQKVDIMVDIPSDCIPKKEKKATGLMLDVIELAESQWSQSNRQKNNPSKILKYSVNWCERFFITDRHTKIKGRNKGIWEAWIKQPVCLKIYLVISKTDRRSVFSGQQYEMRNGLWSVS